MRPLLLVPDRPCKISMTLSSLFLGPSRSTSCHPEVSHRDALSVQENRNNDRLSSSDSTQERRISRLPYGIDIDVLISAFRRQMQCRCTPRHFVPDLSTIFKKWTEHLVMAPRCGPPRRRGQYIGKGESYAAAIHYLSRSDNRGSWYLTMQTV